MHKTKEVRQQKSTKSIKHQKSSKSNEVKPTKKFKNAKELKNLKEVKNTKEVKTHILVFLPDIIYDASCKLKEYALNREPKRFMSIRVTSDRFHENNHKTCSSSFKTSSYPSLRNAPKHVSNLIVSCAEFQARPPSCSSPYSWEPLLCSSLTKISLPTKKNKQQFQNVDPLFFHLPCLLIQASPYLRYISQKCVSRH